MGPRTLGLAVLLVATLASTSVPAQQLYSATVRSIAEAGSDTLGGSLYAVDLKTAATTLVAPIRLDGTVPLGVTGLAVHPVSGVFYGITSPLSRNSPTSLVIIDPKTGTSRMVGPLKQGGSDIAFNRAGILFTWLPTTSQLGVVNLETGNVTPIGDAGPPGPPAGLAIDPEGTAYITPKGATGTIDIVDIGTGVVKVGPVLIGAPFDSNINSMSFTPSGLLIAVNSNAGSPANARLVTINTASGMVSTLGNLPDDTDALAFAAGIAAAPTPIDWRTMALFALAAVGLILGFIGWFVGRKAA